MKSKRPRTVFGRRVAKILGRDYQFEMRKDGLVIRAKYARKSKEVSFLTLAYLVDGQKQLPL